MRVRAYACARVHVRVHVHVVKAPISRMTGGCLFNVAYICSNFALCMNLDDFVKK